MKLGQVVDTNKLIELGGALTLATCEYSKYTRWKIRPGKGDLLGDGYIVTGKRKTDSKEVLLGQSKDHDAAYTHMQKLTKTQYRPEALQHVA